MLRETNKATGKAKKVQGTSGERSRDACRERECRDVEKAISKGYRNKAIENFFKL